jgi:predicted Rossmann-fold nucleotide-binding protein
MIKIGIVGSRIYIDKKKVEEVVDQCIKKYGAENICIISGGAIGADTLGKIAALEKKLKYIEYNPAHTTYNEYSGKPKEFYGKSYKVQNFFERNSFIAEDSDLLIAFIPKGHQSNGTMDTIEKMKKLNKPYFIID